MPYRIELARKARKFLVSLPDKTLRTRLKEAIDGLSEDARPQGCLKMKGEEGFYRDRVGDYRISYKGAKTQRGGAATKSHLKRRARRAAKVRKDS